jgi:hypothetical protein
VLAGLVQTLTKETRQVQTQVRKRLGLKSSDLAPFRSGELFEIDEVLGKSSRLVFMGEVFGRGVALQVNLLIDRPFMIA